MVQSPVSPCPANTCPANASSGSASSSPDTPQLEASPQGAKRTILIAEHAGFCHGVKKAVNRTVEANNQTEKPVYVLGQLIHNQQEVDRLAQMGIQTVQSLEEIPAGSVCVIRTHGAPPSLVQQAQERGIEVTDATCPDVRLVQDKAIELVREGYTVVVVGKSNHPEVIGIRAYAEQIAGATVVAVNHPDEALEALKNLPKRRIGVVSQTTQMEDTFFDTVRALSKLAKELKVHNTICPATYYRQHAALDLSAQVDLMVVVGGKNSSNTTHLAQICKDQGTETIHIETWQELEEYAPLQVARRVGVTAGASTPDWLVDEVIDYLSNLS
ncbi:MAG: 4-hydroxy-3-methylbut-2-enyl diphosphate reductase [Candidatus Melainabacteria bacterium]|nr:4-hydroxy-3-methylbut-2-enyl diphosphate reductase [Candidatus Melainabacteria bacterium]